MDTKPTAETLAYSSDGPRHRRRALLRRGLLVVIVLGIVVGAFSFRLELKLRGERIYWGWKCAHHVTPEGTVLVENDFEKAKTLLENNADYVLEGTQGFGYGLNLSRRQSRAGVRTWAVYWPRSLREYCRFVSPSQMMSGGKEAIVYMGARTSPGGHRRLVVIPFAELNGYDAERLLALSNVIPLPGLWGNIPAMNSRLAYNYSGRFVSMRLSPGVADGADASHVSLDYEVGGGEDAIRGTIDVYLRDDDTLMAKFRDPGAKGRFQ